jgi:branched-chain amino acid transport system permease protein
VADFFNSLLGLQRARFEAFGVTEARTAKLVQDKVFGVAITGEILTHYLVFAAVAALFLLLLRVVNSPSARVLELSPRTRFASKRLATHRLPSHARYVHFNWRDEALFVLWLRYVDPDTALSFSIQVDFVVSGLGSLNGAIVGAAVFLIRREWPQDVMAGIF